MEHDDELALLVGTLVKIGQTFLKSQKGEFLPFAAFVSSDGKVEMLSGDLGVPQPKSLDMIEFLRSALRAMAEQKKIKAAGICVNVGARLPGYPDKVDAICCFIERVSEAPIDFYVPFRKGFLGRLKYDQAIVLPGTPRIFMEADGTANSAS